MSLLSHASKLAFRLAALAIVAGAGSACSSVPDWVDPATWVGSGSDQTETTAADSSAPAPDEPGSEGKTVAEASDKYPTLADTPNKAPPTTSTDDQKQVANGLVADRTQAQYSAEALRAGAEQAAAPPPPPGAEPVVPPPSDTSAAPAETSTAATPPPPPPTRTAATPPATSSIPGTLPSESEPAVAAPPPQQQVASAAPPPPPPAPAPAAPPPAARVSAPPPAVQMNSGDAALGFQPSHAPPLDPGVAQLVSSPNRTRGRQVAAIAPAAYSAPPALAAPSGSATAVVVFGQETTILNDEARAQVKKAAESFRTQGGQGYIRVVGHSSAGGKLSAERKMVVDLERSQSRANAVARELIKDGVPVAKVLVEAAGDTRSGPDGERRADIFLQS